MRLPMSWLHTWAGVALGALLFAIFWMGTLTVFDREIDRWMQPDTRLVSPARVSLDPALTAARTVAPDAGRLWRAGLISQGTGLEDHSRC